MTNTIFESQRAANSVVQGLSDKAPNTRSQIGFPDLPPQFPILRADKLSLAFGIAALRQYHSLVKRLNAEHLQCVYVLLGTLGTRSVARGGKTGEPLVRLGTHLDTQEFRHLTHVAIIAGKRFTKDDVAALECLVLRQIAAVGAMSPRCKGPEMLQLTPTVWRTASDAFLFLRWSLEKARVKLLEPCSPQHPASLLASASGNRERWISNAFDARRQLVGNGGRAGSEKIYLDRGDYITIAEKRGDAYWLLAGSEIRANAVASARKEDRVTRASLLDAGHATPVRGFPDRLELLIDWKSGYSVDRLTKFVMGSSSSENYWRPFYPNPNNAPVSAPAPAI